MFNKDLYMMGMEEFEAITDRLSDDDYYEARRTAADNAWYNDNYKVASVAIGYFVITEEYGAEQANVYLVEHEEQTITAVA